MSSDGPKRVLIVEDSPLVLEVLHDIISNDPRLSIAGAAVNGKEAVAAVKSLQPDLVVMDVHMPVMDGLDAVDSIMSSRPTPILLCSGDPERLRPDMVFEAISRGALDVVAKPELMSDQKAQEFCEHLLLLASIPVVYRRRRTPRAPATPVPLPPATLAPRGVGIVGSTGGPGVLGEILAGLGRDVPVPVLVVQHLAAGFAPHLASWLRTVCPLQIRVAAHGDILQPGVVYIAPTEQHMALKSAERLEVSAERPPVRGQRPSGDVLFDSMVRHWREGAIGVILSGMGDDGAQGLLALRRAGALTLAQERDSCVVYGMPGAAVALGAATRSETPWKLGQTLHAALRQPRPRRASR